MYKPLVIGFLGRAGSGKSTAAQHLIDTHGAMRMPLAAPLKKLAKLLWDFSDEQVYGTQAQKEALDPRWNISPRTAMIRLGDGARQMIGPKVWLNACLNAILNDAEERKSPMPIYVIDDVRYTNEVEDIVSNTRIHGRVIKLVCTDSDSQGFENAPSEVSIDRVPEKLLTARIECAKSPGSEVLKRHVGDAFHRIFYQYQLEYRQMLSQPLGD